jgi:hypothetical protein
MKLNKQTREGLEIYGEALVEYADGFDIDDLDDLFGEEPLDDIEMDDLPVGGDRDRPSRTSPRLPRGDPRGQ